MGVARAILLFSQSSNGKQDQNVLPVPVSAPLLLTADS